MSNHSDPGHWLLRPNTIRAICWLSSALLALTVLAQLWIELHPQFGADAWFGFNAGFGLLSCVLMVLVAKVLGWLVKRPQDYYRQDD